MVGRPQHRLGWRWSRPNDLSGPDQRPVRDAFMELQRYTTWPHIGLRFSGVFGMGTTFTTSIVPMSLISVGSVSSDLPDPYSLYRTDEIHCIVPSEFEYWLMNGSATFLTAGSAGTPIRTFGFTINDTTTEDWRTHGYHNLAGGLRGTTSMIERVKAGDKINVCASINTGTENLSHARAYLYFLPLA